MEHNILVTKDNNQHNCSFAHHLACFYWLKLTMRFSSWRLLVHFRVISTHQYFVTHRAFNA